MKKLSLFRQLLSNQLHNKYFYRNQSKRVTTFVEQYTNGPQLKHFIQNDYPNNKTQSEYGGETDIPYLNDVVYTLRRKKVYFCVYGCQMNVNDTEVVWAILKKNDYLKTDKIEEADIILMVTCAIRDNAEMKIWNALEHYKAMKKKRPLRLPLKIGVLGCMAERLKHQLLEKEKSVDLVAGPDSYKDLPRLLNETDNNQTAINVMLSLDETYADVMPIRLNSESKSAYVTIMRGCDNMCTYCIVPFTRGRERSRPIDSIIDEVKQLSEQGFKEVTLLGQNVNSYRDVTQNTDDSSNLTNIAKGFKTVYKPKKGGIRFADLLYQVSLVDPEMRIRFTSPHPKDFPDEVLQAIKEQPNICKSLHLPAQAGSSSVLERMRRGYTREAYLELVDHVRNILPGVTLSTDIICGFCHETDEEFQETLSLMEKVKFNMAYTFAYSMREKTTAHRRYVDDISSEVKENRLRLAAGIFRKEAEELNKAQIGDIQLVLVEGKSRRSDQMMAGRNDGNIRTIIPNIDIPTEPTSNVSKSILPGDYVAVKIENSTSQSLKGTPLFHTTLTHFHNKYLSEHDKLRSSQFS